MKSNLVQNKLLLFEVIPIRLFLVVMLVFYHAFAIYSGAWKPIEGYPEIPIYNLLDKLSYACLLETFVFISGCVLGFQVVSRGFDNVLNAKSIFLKKFKRLIIPSIVFSILYLILFEKYHQPIATMINQTLCGVGHMWFLPMLFWCFTLVYAIENISISQRGKVVITCLLPFASILPLPLRIGEAFYYFVFFYLGYLIMRNKLVHNYNSKKVLPILLIGFIIFFVIKIYWNGTQIGSGGGNYQHIYNFLHNGLSVLFRMVCASIGILILMTISSKIVSKTDISQCKVLLKLSDCCFGVYIFQQFVLKYIYDETAIPTIIDPYMLPWISFLVALCASIVLTMIIRCSYIGKKIL